MRKALFFKAYYCGACNIIEDEVISPLVEEGYHIEVVDAMKSPYLADRYRVKNIPNTVILGDEGRAILTIYGRPEKDQLRKLLGGEIEPSFNRKDV